MCNMSRGLCLFLLSRLAFVTPRMDGHCGQAEPTRYRCFATLNSGNYSDDERLVRVNKLLASKFLKQLTLWERNVRRIQRYMRTPHISVNSVPLCDTFSPGQHVLMLSRSFRPPATHQTVTFRYK